MFVIEKIYNYSLKMIEIQSQNELVILIEEHPVVLIIFYARWCEKFAQIVGTIEGFSIRFSQQIKFVKIDIDQMPELRNEYSVFSLPTFIIVKNQKIEQKILIWSEQKILRALKEYTKLDLKEGVKNK